MASTLESAVPGDIATGNEKCLPAVVLDACAFVRRVPLHPDNEYFTTQSVVDELVDAQSLQYFQQSIVPIQIRRPSPEAMQKGDRAILSNTDIQVMALAADLERHRHGGSWDHLRTEPIQPVAQVGKVKDSFTDSHDDGKLEGWYTPPPRSRKEKNPVNSEPEVCIEEEAVLQQSVGSMSINDDKKNDESVSNESSQMVSEDGEEDEDDDAGWITPSSLKQRREQQAKAIVATDSPKKQLVICMTDDFAMQNVLMHMGLCATSSDGRIIRQLKRWVLRCHACYTVTHDSDKQFCPSCGNATLLRTSTSLTADGQWHLHLKSNFQYRIRGTKYSLPPPETGKHARNLVLREDQKEYVRAVQYRQVQRRKAAKALETGSGNWDDTLPSLLTGQSREVDRRVGGSLTVGYGRRNPNQVRRKG